MNKIIQKDREFFITINVTSGLIEPFTFKIPPELISITGFAVTHNRFNVALVEDDAIPQIGQIIASFNNGSSHPINHGVKDNPIGLTSRKIGFQTLNEETKAGEYIEGFYDDFGVAGSYVATLHLQGKIKFD